MGAIVKNVYVAYKDNKTPITLTVYYSDNGYSDTIQKTLDTKDQAKDWLKLWYSDTSGGFEYLKQAETVVNNLKE